MLPQAQESDSSDGYDSGCDGDNITKKKVQKKGENLVRYDTKFGVVNQCVDINIQLFKQTVDNNG